MSGFRDWLRRRLGITQIETPASDVPHADCLSLDFLFAETKEMLVRQFEHADALDSKAGLIAGFAGVIITAAVGFLPSVVGSTQVRWPALGLEIVIGVMALGIVAVLLSFIFASRAFWVQSYKDVVKPSTAYEKWIYWNERASKMQLRANMADSYEKNEVILSRKATAIKAALWSLLVGLVLFCLSAVGYIMITVK